MSHTTWATFSPWPVGWSVVREARDVGLAARVVERLDRVDLRQRRQLLAEQRAPARAEAEVDDGDADARRRRGPAACSASAPVRSTPCEMTLSAQPTAAGPAPADARAAAHRRQPGARQAHLQRAADAQRDRPPRRWTAAIARASWPWRATTSKVRGGGSGGGGGRDREGGEGREAQARTAHRALQGRRRSTRHESRAAAGERPPQRAPRHAEERRQHADREERQPERERVLARDAGAARARRRTSPRAGRCR